MTTSDLQIITDQTDIRKYFSMIEHLADDELDPYEYRLLGHYKRVCGENDGTCTEGIRTSADICHMSQGKASEVRQALHDKGWIKLEIKKRETEEGKIEYIGAKVTLINRWLENLQTYSKEGSDRCSLHEHPPSPHEQGCSPGEIKKNKYKKPMELPSGNSLKKFGFEINQTLFRVDEKRSGHYSLEVIECTVVRFTPQRVVVRFEKDGDTLERPYSPKSLHKEKPKLERHTTPLQDVIAFRSFGIANDAPIGRSVAITLKDIAQQVKTSHPDMTPEALDRIYANYDYTPQKASSVMGMIQQYQKEGDNHNGHQNGSPGRASRAGRDIERRDRPNASDAAIPPVGEKIRQELDEIRANLERQKAGRNPGGAASPDDPGEPDTVPALSGDGVRDA